MKNNLTKRISINVNNKEYSIEVDIRESLF